jgi:hypothetical protein
MVRVCGNSARQLCWGNSVGATLLGHLCWQPCWATLLGQLCRGNSGKLSWRNSFSRLQRTTSRTDLRDWESGCWLCRPPKGADRLRCGRVVTKAAYACSMTRGEFSTEFRKHIDMVPRLRGHCLAIVAIAFIGRCQDAHQQRTRCRFGGAHSSRRGHPADVGVLEWWDNIRVFRMAEPLPGRPTSRFRITRAAYRNGGLYVRTTTNPILDVAGVASYWEGSAGGTRNILPTGDQ